MFENGLETTLFATILIALQIVWWWRVLRKPKSSTDHAWVLYASQSGQAQNIAEQTAAQLTNNNKPWQAISLADWLRQHELSALNGQTILFVVSTQGEGNPPDNAVAFFHKLHTWQGDLSALKFAVLGLGDSRYSHFCGFAHNLQQSLKHHNARPLFDIVTVDNLSIDDLRRWQAQLNHHVDADAQALYHTDNAQTTTATLIKRHCENPDSPHQKLFSLDFVLHDKCVWQAGDIAEITIPNKNTELLRHYTLSNLATANRRLSLLVRQVQKQDGSLGAGSGYLTTTLPQGDDITISIRNNPNFHLPTQPSPILFIATGSGLAGILALLQQAEQDWGNTTSHHLIYGERHPEYDTPCRTQLDKYTQSGLLQIDYCFSRGDKSPNYVQNALLAQADHIADFINSGAMVYICGSKSALGESIPATLRQCLGNVAYQTFIDRHGLRLDVY